MKKVLPLLLAVVCLTGCARVPKEMERAMALRSRLLQASSCTFDAEITADYGEVIQTFAMNCAADPQGGVSFRVTGPKSIAGITGKITGQGGALTFDDVALQFDLMADDQVTPVSAPWILLKTLRSGYLTAAGTEGDQLHLTIDDSYEDDALTLDIWLDGEDVPIRAEILYDGRRILSLTIVNFQVS